jgi:hypothetical protein
MGLFKLKLKRDFVTSKKKHLLLEGDEVGIKVDGLMEIINYPPSF